MKKLLLIAATIAFVTGGHSLMAQNLVTNPTFTGTSTATVAGWTFTPDAILTTSTGVISGSSSALLSVLSDTNGGTVTSSTAFATTVGATYIVEFAYKSVNSASATNTNIAYVEAEVGGTNGSTKDELDQFYVASSTGSTPALTFFTANSALSKVLFTGAQASVDDVNIYLGTYNKPGRFSGTVKVTGTFPGQNFGAVSSQSVVANVNASGGLTLIQEPSGIVETGLVVTTGTAARPTTEFVGDLFITNLYLQKSGSAALLEPAKGNGLTYTVTYPNVNLGAPTENIIEKATLHKVGPVGN